METAAQTRGQLVDAVLDTEPTSCMGEAASHHDVIASAVFHLCRRVDSLHREAVFRYLRSFQSVECEKKHLLVEVTSMFSFSIYFGFGDWQIAPLSVVKGLLVR